MNITIDTKNKTITLNERVNLGDLVDELSNIINLKEYTIIPKIEYIPTNPIYPTTPDYSPYNWILTS